VAILNENYSFTRTLLEKYQFEHVSQVNPATIKNERPNKLSSENIGQENKEQYSEVDCPLIIQAAIGGDLEIFKYILTLNPTSINLIGHATLSRKNKNSVMTNVLGAAAYYSNVNLVHYILEKHIAVSSVNINFKAQEKKAKLKTAKNVGLIKEFTDYTPAFLCIVGEGSEDDVIKILNLLDLYGANLYTTDWNKNNLLHLSAKMNKRGLSRFLVEEKKFDKLINDLNKEGESPYSLTNDENLREFLKTYMTTIGSIEEDLNQIIQETEKKKNKKKKGAKKGKILLIKISS
jgi:hypothetical protein